ncbi:MAG: MFS transporter [Candidatus Heimdallarchaeota archaeon]
MIGIKSANVLEYKKTNKTTGKRFSMTSYNSRNIALIAFGAFIWSIYFAIQGQFLNDYIADLASYSPLIISLMISLVSLTGAVTSVIAGAVSDNLNSDFGRRKVFILSGGVTSALVLFLLPLNQSIVFIIGLNVVMSILNTAAFVCNNSFIPDISNGQKLGKTNAFASLGTSIGTVAGFTIMLLNLSSNVFFFTGAICSLGFLLVGFLFQEPKTLIQPKKWYLAIRETFQLSNLKMEKKFFRFLISQFLLHIGINCYMPFLLIFLTQENDPISGELIGLGLSLQNGEVLIVFAVMTCISLLFTLPFGTIIDKTDTRFVLIISRIAFAFATALIALTPIFRTVNPLILGIIFIIPFAIANTADIISRGALMHILAPKEKRGQFLGILFLAKILAQIPGVFIGGIIAQFFQRGYMFGFIIGGIFLLLSIPFIILSGFKNLHVKRIEKTTTPT